MKIDKSESRVEVSYAWTSDVLQLTDNKNQAIGFQKSVERKLRKQGEMELYNKELQKAISLGYLVELDDQELENYQGPVSYVSLILELTKKWSAVLGREINPHAAVLLKLSTYVDETLGGGSPEKVARFKGV